MSTTLTLAMNGTAAPCIEDLRLEADQAGLTDWAQGKALHVLIDAIENTGVADAAKEFSEAFRHGCDDEKTAIDDALTDLEKSFEAVFQYLDDEEPANEKEWKKEVAALRERLKKDVAAHRKTMTDTIRELSSTLEGYAGNLNP